MLIFYRGKMFYSDALGFALAFLIPCVALSLAWISLRVDLEPGLLAAVDRVLAFLAVQRLLVPFLRCILSRALEP